MYIIHFIFNTTVFAGIECGFPASIKHGEYTLINNTVSYLSQVLYSCEEGFEMTGNYFNNKKLQ